MASDPGGLSSLGGQEKKLTVMGDDGGGGFIHDALAPHKEGKSKSVSL